MRTSSTLAALLLAVAGFAGQAVAQSREAAVPQAVRPEAAPLGPVPLRAVPLKVVLYPFMPGKDAYFRQVEADFEQRYPAIDLQVVDLSANYYDEGAPEAVTNTAADVIELDSVFMEDFIASGKIRPLRPATLPPAGTFLRAAEQAVTHQGRVYGLPHWVCANFLFSRKDDPIRPATLQELAAAIGTPHAPDQGLLIDLKGRLTLGEWYLDTLLDRHQSLQAAMPYLDEATADPQAYAALTRVRGLCDSDLCRHSRYHDATGFYPVQFARHRGRALAGYSERLYHIGTEDLTNCKEGECLTLDDVVVSALPLSDRGSQPFLWVDSFVVSRSCSGVCSAAADAFLAFMSDAGNVRKALMPGYGEAPRYLLPALKSLYSDSQLTAAAPLYPQFQALIENAIPVRAPQLNRKLRAIGTALDKNVLPK